MRMDCMENEDDSTTRPVYQRVTMFNCAERTSRWSASAALLWIQGFNILQIVITQVADPGRG